MSSAGVSREPRPRLLIYIDHFLPGLGYGGPVGSVRNLTMSLRNDYDIEIVTRDCAFRTHERFTEVEMQRVRDELGARIHYIPNDRRLPLAIARHLKQRHAAVSVIYLNSLVSRKFTLLPALLLRLWRSPAPVIIATRGELSPGSLKIHAGRKKGFLAVARATAWYKRCRFHASTEIEKADILRVLPDAQVSIAHVVAEVGEAPVPASTLPAPSQELRICIVARLKAIKGHAFLIDVVRDVPGKVHLVFAGELDDDVYWRSCVSALRALPDRITWEYIGVVDASRRSQLLAQSHLFVLPTQGESYGHAIGEALSAGCPVITSDRTPWHGLAAAGAGANLALESRDEWVRQLTAATAMTLDEHLAMRARARAFRATVFPASIAIQEHREMFAAAANARAERHGSRSSTIQ